MQKIDLQVDQLTGYDKEAFCRYFGIRVNESRIGLGLSQQELANRLGLKLREIQLIEKGRKTLEQNIFERICLLLDLDVDDIEKMARITHAQYLMDFLRMIDGNYPR